ncbi:MAG: alpha-L-fucosidase [Bacteroidales bacterium]|nr:alpha-L-fucosidase [Bacteroidales bacterium]
MRYSSLISSLACATAIVITACGRVSGPEPYGPLPTPQQVEWQKMEMNFLVCFGPNTFTGMEWGLGTEAEDVFNPSDLDCDQWASIAKAAGFKGMIIVAKHHDGFCLWPNPESTHTVARSPWKGGKGDVLKEMSEACASHGLKFGIYISPWDRNDPHYGTPEYNDVYVRTLESALDGRYGEVFEEWFDGACGEGPNGKRQVYDWPRFHETVLKYQPKAVMFSDVGPGCRWVGNERGVAGRTNWSTFRPDGFAPGAGAPPTDTLQTGNIHGNAWVPAETDVPLRPGWFWRESENDKVKSLNELLSIYNTSVGRNSLLLLGVAPDITGRIHPADSARILEFGSALRDILSVNLADGAKVKASSSRGRGFKAINILDGEYDYFWAAKDGVNEATLTFELAGEKTFNRVLIQEYIPLGQRVKSFSVEVLGADGKWKEIANETTIGFKRIVPVETVSTSKVRVSLSSYAPPVINGFGLYMDEISGARL